MNASDNDQLTKLMRALDPAHTPENTPADQALLAQVTATPAPLITRKPPRRTVPRGWPGRSLLVAAAALVAVLTLVFVPLLTQPIPAVALTPPPLTFTPTSMTPAEVLAMTTGELKTDGGPLQPIRGSHDTGWYLQQDTLTDGQTHSVISPQVTTLRWNADGSGRVTITAGRSYWSDDSENSVPSADAPAEGSILSDTRYSAGEFVSPITEEPGTTPDQLRTALIAGGMPSKPTGSDMIEGVYTLLGLWTLTNQQHASLLRLLLTSSDVELLGTTTDRGGRKAIGIATDGSDGTRAILLVSTTTGRIIGYETITTVARGDIPAGATTAYTIWKDTTE